MTNIIALPKESIEAAGRLLEKVYDDSLQPSAKEVGKILKDIFTALRLLTFPVQGLAFLQRKIDKFLDNAIEQVNEQNRIMPPEQVIFRIYQELCINNLNTQTSQLLANLMARFIDETRVEEAHPAFLIIIPQLSNDEITMLTELKSREYKLIQYSKLDNNTRLFYNKETKENDFPLEKLNYKNNFGMYIDHLHSLNLAGIWQVGNQIPDNNSSGIQQGVTINSAMRLIPFGKLFVKACL